jgi:hypothetical protein
MNCLFQQSFFTRGAWESQLAFAVAVSLSFMCVPFIFLSDRDSYSESGSEGFDADHSSASLTSGGSLGGAGGPGRSLCGAVKRGYTDEQVRALLYEKLGGDYAQYTTAWFDDEMPFGIGNEYQELRLRSNPGHRDNKKLCVVTEVDESLDTGVVTTQLYLYPSHIFPKSGTPAYDKFLARRHKRQCAYYTDDNRDERGASQSFKKEFSWISIPISATTIVHVSREADAVEFLADEFVPKMFKRKSTVTLMDKLRAAKIEGLSEQAVAHAVCSLLAYFSFDGALFIPFAHERFLPEKLLNQAHLMLITEQLFKVKTAREYSKILPRLFEEQCAAMARLLCLWYLSDYQSKDVVVGALQFLNTEHGSREAERLLIVLDEPVGLSEKAYHIRSEFDLKNRIEGVLDLVDRKREESVSVKTYVDAFAGIAQGIKESPNQAALLFDLCVMAEKNYTAAPYAALALLEIVGSYNQPTINDAVDVVECIRDNISRKMERNRDLLLEVELCWHRLKDRQDEFARSRGRWARDLKETNAEFAEMRKERENPYVLRTPAVRRVNLDKSDAALLREPLLANDSLADDAGSDDSTSIGRGTVDRGFHPFGVSSGSSGDSAE